MKHETFSLITARPVAISIVPIGPARLFARKPPVMLPPLSIAKFASSAQNALL